MDEEMFKRLNQSSFELASSGVRSGARAVNALNNSNTTTIIQIYLNQEKWGGYGRRGKKGWLKMWNFGIKSLDELEENLREGGFPELRDAPRVIREYLDFVLAHYPLNNQ